MRKIGDSGNVTWKEGKERRGKIDKPGSKASIATYYFKTIPREGREGIQVSFRITASLKVQRVGRMLDNALNSLVEETEISGLESQGSKVKIPLIVQ